MVLIHAVLLLLGISFVGGIESGIIGGLVATPHSRPYMASIQIRNGHVCGGMLIREDYILTAAHCLKYLCGLDHFDVVLGAHNIKPQRKEQSQQRIQVIKKIPHPKFQRNEEIMDYSYDIMLLKLKNEAKVTKFVKVMPLPKSNVTKNMKCSIAGWGSITPNGIEPSHVLREVNLTLEENSVCKDKWKQYFNSDRMICTVSNGQHAFCLGDSGGPLICNKTPQGIVSYTFDGNCTKTEYPQVYVKITSFLHWIKSNMKQ